MPISSPFVGPQCALSRAPGVIDHVTDSFRRRLRRPGARIRRWDQLLHLRGVASALRNRCIQPRPAILDRQNPCGGGLRLHPRLLLVRTMLDFYIILDTVFEELANPIPIACSISLQCSGMEVCAVMSFSKSLFTASRVGILAGYWQSHSGRRPYMLHLRHHARRKSSA